MKQLLLAILTFITVAACCQTPVKYSVVIGNDYIQVDPSGSLDTVSTVNIEPKEYQAVLTVNGALSPSISVKKNTLSGDISWAYSSTGTWTGTLSGAFASGRTYIYAQQQGRGSTPRYYTGERTDNNTVTVYAMNSSLALSDPTGSYEILLTIKVYY